MRVMTAGDIFYFWFHKGDLERCVDFNDERLKSDFPLIHEAWHDYKAAKQVLDACVAEANDREDEEIWQNLEK